MKKLMFAVAAMCATVAMADVESANVVGYTQKDMKQGMSATGVPFINVSGAPVDITEVEMTGYDKATYEGASINVQQLTADGGQVFGTYLEWYDDDDGKGWYSTSKGDWVEKGEVVLAPGTGLWLAANSEEEKFASSGEVIQKGADITIRAGQTLVANPIPAAMSFDNSVAGGKFIAVTGYDKTTYEGGSISCQQLSSDGGQVFGTNFEWYDDDDGAGWYDTSTGDWVSDKSLPSGVAMWITGNSTDEKISFPAL